MKPRVKYSVIPNLPPPLEVLRDLAYNLCFSWKDELWDLFQRLDPGLWEECGHNPAFMLGLISQERLDELSRDQGFVSQLERVGEDFNRYLSQPRVQAEKYSPEAPLRVAYFSAEFGLAECLPIYSGGLGVLSGDHLKSASDLNVPLVGVGLLYQEGYFRQYLSADGWQMETYPVNDFANMPVKLVRDEEGRPVTVTVDFKGEQVHVMIWRVNVGRVPLYLLDTNMPSNAPEFRGTTGQLYGGNREMRIRQEIVLGIAGVRALKALGIEFSVAHMNEGHSAFSALERINMLRKEKGISFDAAREIVLASTVFTTHTPVPAGNDLFEPELVRAYFEEYTKDLGINFKVLLGYGRLEPRDEEEPFGMTTLALRLSAHTNAVSRLHGKVSRAMWQKVWPHHPVEDVPIDHITNGIHVPTWTSKEITGLFDRYLGPNWGEDPESEKLWDQARNIPDTELWRTHERCREMLIAFARRRLAAQLESRGASTAEIQAAREVLTPEALTIGFARRFATYKRATLIFADPDRLDRIINHSQFPVQIIIAGKAHPRDNEGKELIKRIIHLCNDDRFRRRVVFLEDYDLYTARYLVSGADLWLNTPRRPLEACGTSGMKALANGSLNLSTLDGWWDEAYHRDLGWALGHGEIYTDHGAQDSIESRDLHNLLEQEVVPLFYTRGSDGIPREWVKKMREGLRRLAPVFSSHRMVQEYMDRYYLPCSRRFNVLCKNNFEGATELARWRQRLMVAWHEVSIEELIAGNGLERPVGQGLQVTARVRLGSLGPDDVVVEAYYGRLDQNGDFSDRETVILSVEDSSDGLYTYSGRVPTNRTGRFGYTVRIMPSHERLENPFAMGLVTWA
ncbi:MAG: alpha-glucan family phosphorylase [Deltaproteobacteria bacterium]|nr:alpha-glucan family phosphorylase [Deltaproteobacteria bacterium]MBW2112440.1 alpha-glucan family phosphorylase [Deltaproteobacteria bacterium]MBW2353269.1 alpha-glucan family phosphorylase [Deltaproteobacteria bacterium]